MKEIVKAEEGEVFDIELEADILEANLKLAKENKQLLRKHGFRPDTSYVGGTSARRASLDFVSGEFVASGGRG